MNKCANILKDAVNTLSHGPLETQEAINDYFIDTMDARVGEDAADPIEVMHNMFIISNTPKHLLYSGHGGCGKSTELTRLRLGLREEDYLVSIFNCEEVSDSQTLKHTDLIVLILESILKNAKENKININDKKLEKIKNYLDTEKSIVIEKCRDAELEMEVEVGAGTPSLLKQVLNIIGNLRSTLKSTSQYREEWRKRMDPDIRTYINMVNDIITDIRIQWKKKIDDYIPVVLIDGLEKANSDAVSEIFLKHSKDFKDINCHLVFSFPIQMCYSPDFNQIIDFYDDDIRLPMIKLRSWNQKDRLYVSDNCTGYEVLREIILKRMSADLFADNVLDLLIEKTGGYLRDLFSVIFDAVLNAIVKKHTQIEMSDAEVAIRTKRANISARIPQGSIERIIDIIDGEKTYSSDEQCLNLLRGGTILEYNGQRWVDTHPLVKEWIEVNGIKRK